MGRQDHRRCECGKRRIRRGIHEPARIKSCNAIPASVHRHRQSRTDRRLILRGAEVGPKRAHRLSIRIAHDPSVIEAEPAKVHRACLVKFTAFRVQQGMNGIRLKEHIVDPDHLVKWFAMQHTPECLIEWRHGQVAVCRETLNAVFLPRVFRLRVCHNVSGHAETLQLLVEPTQKRRCAITRVVFVDRHIYIGRAEVLGQVKERATVVRQNGFGIV